MLYVVGRKNFEVRREKKIITLPCAENNTRQTIDFAVCQKKKYTAKSLSCVSTRQSMNFAVCIFLPCIFVEAPGKVALCRVSDKKHTVKT